MAASVTVVRMTLPTFSCLISCFFLSISPDPRRSLTCSLYCDKEHVSARVSAEDGASSEEDSRSLGTGPQTRRTSPAPSRQPSRRRCGRWLEESYRGTPESGGRGEGGGRAEADQQVPQ